MGLVSAMTSRRTFSDSQPLQRSDFTAQIVDRVIHPHIMSLQKTVQLITGIETEQASQFRLGDATGPIFFHGKPFERPTRQITASCAEASSKIVRDFDVQVHGIFISFYQCSSALRKN